MSSSTQTPASIGVAPWRPLFMSHLKKLKEERGSEEFVLTTLHKTDDPKSPTPYLPRARYCIFRGMFAELPENKHYDGPKNVRAFESDLLTFTTDVRMEKVPDLFASSKGHGDVSQSQGSGGGGPVEAIFWIKDIGTQWRFRGTAYVVGPDIEGDGEESSGVRTVKDKVGARMRIVDEDKKDQWSWHTELTGQFGNLSPGMRGSFKNPHPGKAVGLPVTDEAYKLGQKDPGLDDEASRKNFRVVIIMPDEVEQLDLVDPDKARRWKYTFVGPNSSESKQDGEDLGEWKTEELWP